jgi:hypothetical protein
MPVTIAQIGLLSNRLTVSILTGMMNLTDIRATDFESHYLEGAAIPSMILDWPIRYIWNFFVGSILDDLGHLEPAAFHCE